MKNIEKWRPTKFISDRNGTLVGNRDHVNRGSLLVVNKIAILYQEFLKKYANGILLDLGCGTAPLFHEYNKKVNEVICIDWENSCHKNIHLDFVADLSKNIPLDSNSVNTVLLSDVLEHISEPQKLMAEISRVMRPGGILILGVPFFYWLHESPYDFNRYTKYQLEKLCFDNNLIICELKEWGGPLSVILDIMGKNWPKKFGQKIFQNIAIKLINSHFGRKIDQRNKHLFPLGYCLVAQKRK